MNRIVAVIVGLCFASLLAACGSSSQPSPSDTRIYTDGSVAKAIWLPGSGSRNGSGSPATEATCTDVTIHPKGDGTYKCTVTYADGTTVPGQLVNVDNTGHLSNG